MERLINSKYVKDSSATVAIAHSDEDIGFEVFFANYRVLPYDKYLVYISILQKYGLKKEIINTRSIYGKKEVWKASSRDYIKDLALDLKNQGINVLLKGKEL